MRFDLNEDQRTFFTVLEQMTASDDAEFHNAEGWGRFEWSAPLDATLEENGFFDAAAEETLGTLTAAAMVYQLAQLPVLVECAASAMLRPLVAADLPRPIAVIDGDPSSAVRFLPVAKSVLHLREDGVSAASLSAGDVTNVDSLYAYPMGTVEMDQLSWEPLASDPAEVLDLWRVAQAAEMIGAMKGGLEAVLTYVREREQFGRPLGSFQGIQHRLATAASQIEGGHLLVLRAAQGLDSADPAMALGYAQGIAGKIGNDLHQFMGAMGLTLEHPLHRWTYRIRLLRSALGGASGNFRTVAKRRWEAA